MLLVSHEGVGEGVGVTTPGRLCWLSLEQASRQAIMMIAQIDGRILLYFMLFVFIFLKYFFTINYGQSVIS
jgi:hypothetical protein